MSDNLMNQNGDATPAMLAHSHVRYLLKIAHDYKSDAIKIKIYHEKDGSLTATFETLASLCLEMFPKVLIGSRICMGYKKNQTISYEQIIQEIKKEMSNTKHDLQKLYDNDQNLCQALNIELFSTVKNKYNFYYLIELKDSKKIYLKNFASIRYGTFSENKNYAIDYFSHNAIQKLLEDVERYTFQKLNKSAKLLIQN